MVLLMERMMMRMMAMIVMRIESGIFLRVKKTHYITVHPPPSYPRSNLGSSSAAPKFRRRRFGKIASSLYSPS